MYVCVCNAVTDRAIRRAARDGVRTFEELRATTGCSGGCGCCEPTARKLFAEALAEARALPLDILPAAVAA
ncbi:MAG TPA: (2Fe-2S)-binding protein [Rhodanobacteraceae bacterium]|nr:(2Fe-2S)-binding protein [Rhodanobacteraceae bacterium]